VRTNLYFETTISNLVEVTPTISNRLLQFFLRVNFQFLQHLYLFVNFLLFNHQFLLHLNLIEVNATKRAVQLVELLTIGFDLVLLLKRFFKVYLKGLLKF
jgi:hypothetical protein